MTTGCPPVVRCLLLTLGLGLAARAADLPVSVRLAMDACRAGNGRLPGSMETALARHQSATGDVEQASARRELLLANPLLDDLRLLVVVRGENQLGMPANWEGNSSLPRAGYDNEVAVLSDLRGEPRLETLYRPPGGEFVGDLDLDFDARRLLLSHSNPSGPWRVRELDLERGGLPLPVPQVEEPDVDNYDACHLPDGNLLFTSTATLAGVPCVRGGSPVANLFRADRADGRVRRLTFDQDHNWCPTPLEDGGVLYLRWEYSDLPHFVSRLLFRMNPDGTEQRAHYGSNSYWPNSIFYARPIPGHPSRFLGVVTGHHDSRRAGELVLFDTARGRHEADGAVQRIPGRGRPVEPVIRDRLVEDSWPKFLHPWPLSEHFFLAAMRPGPRQGWGLYLCDVYDNLTLLASWPGKAVLEPIPLRPRPRPPVLANRVPTEPAEATVIIQNLLDGPGLAGVPPGTVKALRLFTYHFSYRGIGGQMDRVGFDGPWDIKRVLGSVPVEPDGSAHFKVPGNTPISLQPLDADGQALQLMRSWFTAMPGETVSCTGCHESRNQSPPGHAGAALARAPSVPTPWHAHAGGFSFRRDVQPVLDRNCTGCHGEFRDGPDRAMGALDAGYNQAFPPSYLALRRFTRTPTMESDMHLLEPGEFQADTTELFQRLRAGHQGVRLEPGEMERLVTWFDLNTPAHGTWTDVCGESRVGDSARRRAELLERYAGVRDQPEAGAHPPPGIAPPQPPTHLPADPARPLKAPALPAPHAVPATFLDLGDGVALDLLPLPGLPLRMGRIEVTNRQYARFDPSHDSGIEVGDFLQFGEEERGFSMRGPEHPVVRVSAGRAEAFCRWLSARAGMPVRLPSETEWEAACRAGTTGEFWYGDAETDFSRAENLADRSFHLVGTHSWKLPSGAIPPWRPALLAADDGQRVSAPCGHFAANPWGLHDMHGNVAEWTSSSTPEGRRVVRGGSFADRPVLASATVRRDYPAWRRVYNVGFRIVAPPESSHARVP